jgi:hypothetical protein
LETNSQKKYTVEFLSKINKILINDSPIAPILWLDNNIIYNKKIKQAEVSPLGGILRCWDWEVSVE